MSEEIIKTMKLINCPYHKDSINPLYENKCCYGKGKVYLCELYDDDNFNILKFRIHGIKKTENCHTKVDDKLEVD